MNIFDFSFWQSFVSNLLATVIGVGLGIPVALWINRWVETRTEKERKNKILSLLKDELTLDKEDLELWKQDRAKKEKRFLTSIILVRDETWRTFSDGGELEWIKDLYLLNLLAGVYYYIKRINFYSEKAFQLQQTSWISEEVSGWTVRDLLDQLSIAVDSAIELIEITINELEDQVSKDT